MKVVLLLVCAFALAAAFVDNDAKKEFKEWLAEHGKNYTSVEYVKREAIYAKNRAKRIANNLKYKLGQIGWEEEANDFSDLTTEEFLKRLGYKPAPIDNSTANYIPAHIAFPDTVGKRFGNQDWRAKGKVGPVKNQGGCGSCWTFSATCVVESCVAISQNMSPPDLSEQNFQDCLASKVCSPGGGWPSSAIDFAKSNGQGMESDYPYVTKNGNCHSTGKKAHVGQRVSGRTEQDLERMLGSGVVSVALDATTLQSYKRGVIDSTSPTTTNHAVTVVALTDQCDGKASQCWVVKNSWGTGWGESGYFRVVKGKPGLGAMGIAQVLDTATGCTIDGGNNGGSGTGNGGGGKGPIENADRPGMDLPNMPVQASSSKDCQNKCAARNDCDTWAFDTCGTRCWLKRGKPGVWGDANCRQSGILTGR